MKQTLIIILCFISLLTAKEYAYKTMAPVDFNEPSKNLLAYFQSIPSYSDKKFDEQKILELLKQGADPNVFEYHFECDCDVDEYDKIDNCLQSIQLHEADKCEQSCGVDPEHREIITYICWNKDLVATLKLLLEYGLDPNMSIHQGGLCSDLWCEIIDGKMYRIEQYHRKNATIPDDSTLYFKMKSFEMARDELNVLLEYGFDLRRFWDFIELYNYLDIILKYDFEPQNLPYNICSELSFGFTKEQKYHEITLTRLLNHGFNPLAKINGKYPSQIVKSAALAAIIKNYELIWKKVAKASIDSSRMPLSIMKCDKLLASTELKSDKNQYSIAKLIDNDSTTAWVEGNKLYGLNEGFTFRLSQDETTPDKIIIRNGYTKNETLWNANCRVKRFGITMDSTLIGVVDLEDTPHQQTVNVKDIFLPYKGKMTSKTMGIEIFSIYKGTKYKDIAISEFHITGIKE